MMRAESGTRSVEPTGRTSFSCNARKQLGLHIERQVANFVEEKRAVIGNLHQALLGVHGTGKGPLHVAE